MKTLTKIFLVMVLGVSLVQAAAFTKDAKYKTTKVLITAEQPLTTGSNTFTFKITKNSKRIQDSTVSLRAFMPAMPGMPAMESKVQASNLGNGTYKATLNLAMSGTWQLYIMITPKTGKRSRIKTTLNF